jgi:hypothetical protein
MVYLWIALGMLGVLAVIVAAGCILLARAGRKIPVEHEAISVIDIHAPIEKVFDAIADVEKHPQWSRGVTRVVVLPDTVHPQHGGLPMQTVRMEMGRNSFVLVRTRYELPTLLERTITDNRGPFSGTWLYKLRPLPGDGAACEVRLKETGRVKWPLARALMKYVFGYHKYTHAHLRALAAKFEPHPREPRRG